MRARKRKEVRNEGKLLAKCAFLTYRLPVRMGRSSYKHLIIVNCRVALDPHMIEGKFVWCDAKGDNWREDVGTVRLYCLNSWVFEKYHSLKHLMSIHFTDIV